ncbi:Predicted dehydrogenase [Chitinophaga costaii]|uniref:Predicted dehydrogenase n=1 Tax=Chitinophaga costaii TaxID=1335309 RepID=A0A1C4D7F4_9BACT|nr:Gfo/Idh/MocA family oxidoreductase [Chitinophaga costaii]PUZ24492.1 gfo/Idh/MocA family oxidoreductase [Chitinophaga costaii]SCC27279.1 Predicted dehydrogenase [Chitinophaga costaii]
MSSQSRRTFIRQAGGAALLLGVHPFSSLAKPFSTNDKIRIGCIGMGIMGFGDVACALQVPGVELAGVADLYDGRLAHAKELYGPGLFTTRDYRQLLSRKDIDAVIVATPDFWHDTISIAAMEAGKAVYCEKPMVQQIAEGHQVIDTQRRTKAVFQVGSQRVSSLAFAKAQEHFRAGNIGKLNMVEAHMDRHDALGAWQYSIPTDASPSTVDYDTYLKDTAKVGWDPKRFFRWRNYQAYGTGIPGDLFVHLISGLHLITGSKGPSRIFASGSLSYWKDGRDVPDVMTAIFEYPETSQHPQFQLTLRVNFADGGGGGEATRLIGSEGVLELTDRSVRLQKRGLPKAPGYDGWDSFSTYTKAEQEAYVRQYNKTYSAADQQTPAPTSEFYAVPEGYDDRLDHFKNFFAGVRSGQQIVEDASFGLRAAGPAILTNQSYFGRKEIKWDADKMQVI